MKDAIIDGETDAAQEMLTKSKKSIHAVMALLRGGGCISEKLRVQKAPVYAVKQIQGSEIGKTVCMISSMLFYELYDKRLIDLVPDESGRTDKDGNTCNCYVLVANLPEWAKKPIIDDKTGAILTPGAPDLCEGSGRPTKGDAPIERRCDECEYYFGCIKGRKSPYKTPEEARKAMREMMKEHNRRMETDPEYRKEVEEASARWEKLLYPGEYERKHKSDLPQKD